MTDDPAPESPDEDSAEDIAAEQAHFAAVGRVASNWAYFEMDVDIWAMTVAGINADVAACFTAQVIGPARKLDALMAVCGLFKVSEELQKELRRFSQRALKLAERRNRVIHDFWLVDEGAAHRFEVTARKRLVRQTFRARVGEIEALAEEISILTIQMAELGGKLSNDASDRRWQERRR